MATAKTKKRSGGPGEAGVTMRSPADLSAARAAASPAAKAKTKPAASPAAKAKTKPAASPAAKAKTKAAASSSAKTKAGAKAKARQKPAGRSRYTRAEVEEIFSRLAAALPEPRTELEYVNPYTLLVAVVLSAQATDAGVNRATRGLFALADTPAKMVALGEDRVREAIKTIGLFRNKAKNVIALSRILVEDHGGEVPRDRAALEALPGVGRKTANVLLNVAFGEPTIAVDTHIFRLGNRLGLAPGRTPDEVEAALEKIVPPAYLKNAHHWLILHGRHVCKARRPLCEDCVIFSLCKSPEKRFETGSGPSSAP